MNNGLAFKLCSEQLYNLRLWPPNTVSNTSLTLPHPHMHARARISLNVHAAETHTLCIPRLHQQLGGYGRSRLPPPSYGRRCPSLAGLLWPPVSLSRWFAMAAVFFTAHFFSGHLQSSTHKIPRQVFRMAHRRMNEWLDAASLFILLWRYPGLPQNVWAWAKTCGPGKFPDVCPSGPKRVKPTVCSRTFSTCSPYHWYLLAGLSYDLLDYTDLHTDSSPQQTS